MFIIEQFKDLISLLYKTYLTSYFEYTQDKHITITLCNIEQLKLLKHLLINKEIRRPLHKAKKLYSVGILNRRSFLAVSLFDIEGDINIKTALVNLLFEELDDPLTYEIFKKYYNTSIIIHDLVHQSNSLCE